VGNFDQMLVFGQKLFLEWNQAEMIARHQLKANDQYLYVNYLGQPHRILRSSGETENLSTGLPVGPASGLAILDYLCRDNLLPGMCGRRCPVNSLRNAGRSSPDTTALHQPHADFFQQHMPALAQAIADLGYAPFPHGDIACIFPVFDCMGVVFQFWEGDEEFPPSVRFLWDENTPCYLRYETTYYVMGDFLSILRKRIAEIEKK